MFNLETPSPEVPGKINITINKIISKIRVNKQSAIQSKKSEKKSLKVISKIAFKSGGSVYISYIQILYCYLSSNLLTFF